MRHNGKFGLIFTTLLMVIFLFSCKEDTVQPDLFGTIVGTVLDAETNNPIEGANVTTAPPTSSIVTSTDGSFSFTNIKVGSYTVIVTKSGYDKKSVSVSVKDNETTEATIFMDKSPTTEGPGKVINPTPENNAVDQPRNIDLSWNPAEKDSNLSLMYDVYLYDSNSPERLKIAADIEDTTVHVENLDYEKTYFWQVSSKSSDTLTTDGDVWSFTTTMMPDYRFFYSSDRDGNFEIYTSDSSETDIVRLTNRPFRDWWPRLKPNRTKIAFTSDQTGNFHIYTMDRNGRNILQITTLPVAGFHNNGVGFSWSPDGGKFVYSHYNELYTIDENGANLRLIATAPAGRHFRECEWSHDGSKIVALTIGEKIYNSEIYIMNADGSGMTQFLGDIPGMTESPSFSIDGKNILYTNDVSGFESADGRQLNSHMFIKGISDTTFIDLSAAKPDGTNDTHPRFSPDGAYVIFENTTNDNFNPKSVWITDIATGQDRTLLFSNAETPDWQ